jgi:hypothetical protein
MKPVLRTVLRSVALPVFLGPLACVLLLLASSLLTDPWPPRLDGRGTLAFYELLLVYGALVSVPAGVAGAIALFVTNGLKRRPWRSRTWSLAGAGFGSLLAAVLLIFPLQPPRVHPSGDGEPGFVALVVIAGAIVGALVAGLSSADLESMHGSHAA